MKKKIHQVKASLARRRAALPYELLGRSLAASAFFPRDFEGLFNPSQPGLIKIIKDPSALLAPSLAQAPAAYLLDTSQAQPEGLSLIRRYSQALIIQDDLFIDEYQLLEALVFGADCVILREEVLGWAGLKKFLSATTHLGLASAVEISGRASLARAILAGARILLLSPPEDSSPDFLARLIPQIPAGKFLIAPATCEGVGAVILE